MIKLSTRIPNVAALNDAIADGYTEYAIVLRGGVISRKTITRTGKKYRVLNRIDDTVQLLTEAQLFKASYTNLGMAMEKGALVVVGE